MRTPSVYRCPRSEGESEAMRRLIEDDAYDAVCVDPSPGPKLKRWALGKVKILTPKTLDTPANLTWRNATIAFASGKISPAEWLRRTKGLGETYHFLTSPKTKALRDELWWVPVNPGGTYSARSVFAEMLLLSWPGKPVLCSSDVYATKTWPEGPGQFQSWILAMNDYRGPMLYYRQSRPYLQFGKPNVFRADSQPGLLAYRQTRNEKPITFYFNNSLDPVDLPRLSPEQLTITRGLDMDSSPFRLGGAGSVIEDFTQE